MVLKRRTHFTHSPSVSSTWPVGINAKVRHYHDLFDRQVYELQLFSVCGHSVVYRLYAEDIKSDIWKHSNKLAVDFEKKLRNQRERTIENDCNDTAHSLPLFRSNTNINDVMDRSEGKIATFPLVAHDKDQSTSMRLAEALFRIQRFTSHAIKLSEAGIDTYRKFMSVPDEVLAVWLREPIAQILFMKNEATRVWMLNRAEADIINLRDMKRP